MILIFKYGINEEIYPSITYNELELKSHSYTDISIDNYVVIEPRTKSVTLNEEDPNQEIIFYYE